MENALKKLVRDFIAALDRQDWKAVKETVSPGCRSRIGGQTLDRDGWLAMGQGFYAGFPDGKHQIDALLNEGDEVVMRCRWSGTHTAAFNGIPATGKRVELGLITTYKITDGRIVEHNGQFDSIGMMQQLGVFPAGGPNG